METQGREKVGGLGESKMGEKLMMEVGEKMKEGAEERVAVEESEKFVGEEIGCWRWRSRRSRNEQRSRTRSIGICRLIWECIRQVCTYSSNAVEPFVEVGYS